MRLLHPLLLPLSSFLLPTAHASPKTVTITTAPPIPSSSPEFVTESLFTSAILNSTNFFRAEHNASAVTYNATLERFAQRYLDSSDNGRDCKLAHSGGPYGENLALGCSDAQGCVRLWAAERDEYDFRKPQFGEATGHFTQLVWKNTSAVGCGRRLCGAKGWYLACEYWPRGNVVGEFGEEVGKQVNGTGSAGVRPAVGVCVLWVGLVVLGTGGFLW